MYTFDDIERGFQTVGEDDYEWFWSRPDVQEAINEEVRKYIFEKYGNIR